jgi:hypothetical protein
MENWCGDPGMADFSLLNPKRNKLLPSFSTELKSMF